LVDAWAQTEANKLRFVQFNQKQLRVDLYNGLMDAAADDISLEDIGKRTTILPSSYTGSPRQMIQLYQDALTIIRRSDLSSLLDLEFNGTKLNTRKARSLYYIHLQCTVGGDQARTITRANS
jgi:hypothetical protein